jgi:hypothetical protein
MRYAAPAANMSYLSSFKPTVISTMFFSKNKPAPITITPHHDHYPERFALSPTDRPTFFAGDFSADEFALSPVRSGSRKGAENENDSEVPAPLAIVAEEKRAKKPTPPMRRSARLPQTNWPECQEESDGEPEEAEPKVAFTDTKSGEKYYDVGTVVVDGPECGSKESHSKPDDEDDEACAICHGLESEKPNEIIFCDGCDFTVHQDCYGVPVLPTGDWFCRNCRPQAKKGKQKVGQSANPPKAKTDNRKAAQSTKRKRNSQDEDEAEQQSLCSSKQTRTHSIAMIRDDSEKEHDARVAKPKRNSNNDKAEKQSARPSKVKRKVIIIHDDSEEEQKTSRRVTKRKRVVERDSEEKPVAHKSRRNRAAISRGTRA